MTHDPVLPQHDVHAIACRQRQTGGSCTCGRNRAYDTDFDYYKVGGVTAPGFPKDPNES